MNKRKDCYKKIGGLTIVNGNSLMSDIDFMNVESIKKNCKGCMAENICIAIVNRLEHGNTYVANDLLNNLNNCV